ncbi:MAG: type I restriction endonuclease [Thermosynechococcaceae cyanobacterium]
MVTTLAISKELTNLSAVTERFNLTYTTNIQFFTEWFETLPLLSQKEQAVLHHIQQRFLDHRNRGFLPEGTVDKLIVSPLLDLAGLYEPQFTIRTEASVEIVLEDRDEKLQGRIDTLIVQDQFWILVVEAKNTALSLSVAIPQALTYMMSAPHPDDPVFGLVTNGDEFRFIKLLQSPLSTPQFDLSDSFSVIPPHRSQLNQVLQILKVLQNRVSQVPTQT